MRVLISADMEGVTGVTAPEDCLPGHARWEYCRRLFTGDVNAAVAGFVAAGADEVLVNEAHGYAPDAALIAVKTCVDRYTAVCLPPARSAALIEAGAADGLRRRRPAPAAQRPYTLEVEFDAAHFVGAVTAIPGVEEGGERRVRFTLPTMYAAIRCFKALTTITDAAVEPVYG